MTQKPLTDCCVLARLWLCALFTSLSCFTTCLNASDGAPVIKEIRPATVYPEKEFYKLTIVGENFGSSTNDLRLVLHGVGVLPITWVSRDESTPSILHAALIDDNHIVLGGLPLRDYGPNLTIKVVRAGLASNAYPLRLSWIERHQPALISAVVSVVLLGLPLLLLARRQTQHVVAGKSYGILGTLMLDPETDTFSLSKFQFYLWTAASIFGYVFLTISRSLVQGVFEFADVPENLPSIVLASAGTSVAAQAITNTKGPKGAGAVHPGLADFITSGGIVAIERLQFFLWTLLGVTAFLFLVCLQEPSGIQQLPSIPDNFLYLMGISSAGYLGGKFGRRTGPVIDEIRAVLGSLVLEIKGRGLSKDASFMIDDTPVTLDHMGENGENPRVVQADTHVNNPGLAALLRLNIQKPCPTWLENPHQLTVINPDGQKASWKFEHACWKVVFTPPPNDLGQVDKLKELYPPFSRLPGALPAVIDVTTGLTRADAETLKNKLSELKGIVEIKRCS